MNPQEFAADLAALHRSAVHGCGNHNCVIKPPSGMATNGPCKCRPRDFARTLRTLADALLVDTQDRLGYEWPAIQTAATPAPDLPTAPPSALPGAGACSPALRAGRSSSARSDSAQPVAAAWPDSACLRTLAATRDAPDPTPSDSHPRLAASVADGLDQADRPNNQRRVEYQFQRGAKGSRNQMAA